MAKGIRCKEASTSQVELEQEGGGATRDVGSPRWRELLATGKVAEYQGREVEGKWPIGKTLSCQVLPFTKTLAVDFLELESPGVEREVDDRRVEELVRQAQQGRLLFYQASITVAYCEWDGQTRRLDGQHLCCARLDLADNLMPFIAVQEVGVATPEELRELCILFNSQRPYSSRNTAKARLLDTPEYVGVSGRKIDCLVEGWKFWRGWAYGEDGRGLDTAVVCDQLLMPQNLPLAKLAITCMSHVINCHHKSLFRKAAIYGAILATCETCGAEAEEFWRRLGGSTHASMHDPVMVLDNFLLTHSGVANLFASKGQTATKQYSYNCAIDCFNKFMAGEQMAETWRPSALARDGFLVVA